VRGPRHRAAMRGPRHRPHRATVMPQDLLDALHDAILSMCAIYYPHTRRPRGCRRAPKPPRTLHRCGMSSMIYSLMPSTVPSSAIRHTRTVRSETPRDRERPQGAHATEVTSRLGSLIT